MENEIQAAIQQSHDALNARDIDAVARCITDDAPVVEITGTQCPECGGRLLV
jgi:ketosteroid isomerase-like protein